MIKLSINDRFSSPIGVLVSLNRTLLDEETINAYLFSSPIGVLVSLNSDG